MSYPVTAVVFHIPISEVESVVELNPDTNHFCHFFIGHAKYLNLGNRGMLVKKLLECARVNIFTTSDCHVLDATNETNVARLVHGGNIT